MNKVTSYLKNMTKSVVYATTDVAVNLIPEVKDFAETNDEIMKSVYAVSSHPKQSIAAAKRSITQSQIYKDINKGIDNVFEDIKTGNFYNKARADAMVDMAGSNLASGGDDDFGFNDDFNFDDDFNLDDDNNEDDSSLSISKGDIVVADSINKSANLSAQLISTTVAKTSKSIMQTSMANTNLLMSQNMQLMAGVRTSITGVHESVNSILKFAVENVKPHLDSQANYMTKTQELMVENNAILKEMLEMQRNIYKAEMEKPKSNDQFANVFSGSSLDIGEYIKAVGKNIKNMDNTGTLNMLTNELGGQTMLAQMFANPLGTIVTGLVKNYMPSSLAKSISSFSKTLGGVFPALISRLNRWKKDDDGILGVIGKVFGLNVDDKKFIDVSKYNKGAVPFDGITRKAIVDVIPEHLSKIESLLTGQSQRIYDYSTGKWTSASQIKKDEDDRKNRAISSAFSAYSDDEKRYIEALKKSGAVNAKRMKEFQKNLQLMKANAYNEGSWSPEYVKNHLFEYIQGEEDLIAGYLEAITNESFKGRTSKAMETARSIYETKESESNRYRRSEEKGDDISRKLYDNSNNDNHLKIDKATGLPVGLDYDKIIGISTGIIGKNILDNGNLPKDVIKARDAITKDESRYDTANFNYSSDKTIDDAIREASFVTRQKSSVDFDVDDIDDMGKWIKKESKYKSKADSIKGKTFGEKLSNAKSMKDRYALIMASLNDLSKRPVDMLNGLIYKADKSIYNMLYGSDSHDEFDEDDGKDIKGLMGDMKDKMISTWTLVTETLTEKVIDPLAEKFGLKDKWDQFKEKLGNTSIGQSLKDFGYRVKGSLKDNVLGIKNYAVNSIEDVFSPVIYDRGISSARIKAMSNNYIKANNNDKEKLKAIVEGKSKAEIAKIKKSLSEEELKTLKSLGFAEGGTGIVEKGGLYPLSEGETVTVEKNLNADTEKQKDEEANSIIERIKDVVHGNTERKANYLAQVKKIQSKTNSSNSTIVADSMNAITDYGKELVNTVLGIDGNTPKEQEKSIKKEKSKILNTVVDITSEMKGEGSDLVAKSLIGGGLGLLSGVIGGPLIGAAVGAGTSIIKNSQTVQKFLFGSEEVDEKGNVVEKKGLISKKTQNTFKKYVPDMGKYGIAGMASSLVLPFGPLGGAVLGAGVSLIKNSQTMNEMIFGKDIVGKNGNITKDNSGLLTPARISKIKKNLPKAAAGAIGGMVLGPFGLLGNAALGAGIGLITGTDEFKDLIFGKIGPNGERYGGLKGALDDNFVNPLKDFGTNFKDDFFGFIKQEMIDPLNEAITPITNEIGYQAKRIVFWLPNTIAKLTKDSIATPLIAILNDKIVNPVANLAKGAFGKAFSFGKGVISAPFKGIRALGNRAAKKQIRRGNTVNMSAAQRLQFRETHNMGEDKFSTLDRDMVEMNQEQIEEYDSTLNAIEQGDKYFDREMQKVRKELGKLISKNLKEGKITGGEAGKIRKAINKDDIDGALTLLSEAKKTRNGGKLSDDDYKDIAGELTEGAEKYKSIKLRRDQFGENKEKLSKDLFEKYGLNVNNEKDLKALINNFDEEARRAKARNDIEKSMENPEDLITKGDEGIIEQLKLLREDINNMLLGNDILSSGRQAELDKYSNKADASISKNLSRRVANNKEISKKTGFNDTDIIGLFAINKNLYNTVLKAQGKGVYFSTDNVRNLSKLNKQQLKVIDKLPYLGLLDLSIMKKYTDKHRDKNKANTLNTSIKSGVDINSLDEAAMVTDPNTNANDHKKRAEYYNKLNQLGLVGNKISKEDILSRNGATYAQMDKLIKDQEKLNKLKDDENLNDQEIKNSTTSGSLKDKIKTVFTEHGPISYILNRRGEYKKVNSKQNIETQKEADRDNDERKGIISSLSGIKDSFLGFFGKKKNDKDSDKKSWWEKLLDNPITNAVKKVATVGGILLGVGKLATAWQSEGDDGIMHKLVNKFKDTFSPIITKVTDWLSNSGDYEDENTGLQGLLSNHVFPNLFKGLNVVLGTILPAVIKSFAKALPAIIKSTASGLASLFGWNKNKTSKAKVKINTSSSKLSISGPDYLSDTQSDSQSVADSIINDDIVKESSTDTDAISGADTSASSSSTVSKTLNKASTETKNSVNANLNTVNSNGQLTFDNNYGAYTKDKDGNLVPLTSENGTNGVNDFYTETGAHYVYNSDTGEYESDTTTQHLNDGLLSRLGSVVTRSALTGKTMGIMKIGKATSSVGKALSKVPVIGTGVKVLNGIGNVVGSASTYASKAPELLQYISTRTNAGMKTADAIKDVASASIGTTKIGQFAYKAADTVTNSSAAKLVTKAATTVKNKALSSKAGKKLAELGSKSSSKIKFVAEWIKSGLTKILNNSFIFNKIKDALSKAGKIAKSGKEIAEKTTKEVINNIIEKITNKFAGTTTGKFVEKATNKISSMISTVGIMTLAFSITDFTVGYDQADSILGIENTNFIQKLIAGLCNIINQELFFGFFDTADVLDFLIDIIFPIFNINMTEYKKKKEEANKSAEEYNKLNGTDYSTDEYLKKDSWTYKVSQGWDNIKNSIGSFINKINPFSKKKDNKTSTTTANDAISKAASETKESISAAGNNFDTSSISNTTDMAEANNIAIGYQQAEASTELAQNLNSGYDIMDLKLGKIFGFTNSSGKVIGLSEGVSTFNKNSLNKKSKNEYTFTDIIESNNKIFKEWENTTSSAYKASKSSKSKSKSSSKSSSSKTFYESMTGKGTMSDTGFVSQLDPKFKNKKFNTGKDSEAQTLGDSGCAPATAANVLNLYAGKGSVMDNASNVALKYKDTNSGVTPDYFQSYLGSNGIGTYSTMNKNEMLSGISQGRPTVLLGSDPTNRARTPYGSASSHYVLATGLDGKGNVIIQDPESKRPNSLYPVRDVIKQTTLGMITGKGSMNARDLKSKVKAKLGKVGFGRGSNTVNQDLAKWSPITEGELNSAIRRLAGSNRGFSGKGKYFIEAANASGLDPRYILAHAAIESAWGDSNYAKAGNFFGIGAFDSNPDNAYNYGNDSMESGLINGAKWIRKNFYDAGQTTLYKMRHNGGSHEYATDPDWDTKIANVMDNLPANSSASYHEAGDDSTSSSSSSSSSGYSGLLDSLDDLVFSYYSDDSKNFLKSLFGLDSSSSSDSSDDGDSSSGSSSYSGDAKTAQEFYNKYNGVAVDYDNAYGAQCVDLFKQYSDDVLGLKNYVVPGDGGARNIATDSRLNSYYDKVSLKDAKYGDWVIWNGSQGGGWGHVAMYTGMDSNGNIKAFGTNQGGPSGAANTVSVTSNGVAAVLRPKISGKGSGKYKSTAQYQSLPTNMLNNYRRKSVSVPSASKAIAHMSGAGTSLPSLSNYSLASDNYSTLNSNSYSTFGSSKSSVSNNTRIESLISVVIDVLRIIADNSSKLSEIVTLLSKALDVNLTNDDIQSLSSNNAQIKNKIANALKAQGSSNGMGSAIMNSSTESLADALYTIARA